MTSLNNNFMMNLAHRAVHNIFRSCGGSGSESVCLRESLHRVLCEPSPNELDCTASGMQVDAPERLRLQRRHWLRRLHIRLIPKDHIVAGDQLLHCVDGDGQLYDRVAPWEKFVSLLQTLYPGLLTAFQELCADSHVCNEAMEPVPATPRRW